VFTLTKESKSFTVESPLGRTLRGNEKIVKSGGLRTTKMIQNVYPCRGKLTGFTGNTIYYIIK